MHEIICFPRGEKMGWAGLLCFVFVFPIQHGVTIITCSSSHLLLLFLFLETLLSVSTICSLWTGVKCLFSWQFNFEWARVRSSAVSNYLAVQGCWKGSTALKVMWCHRSSLMADQGSIWLQIVIIAATAFFFCIENNNDFLLHILVAEFFWPFNDCIYLPWEIYWCSSFVLNWIWVFECCIKLIFKSRHLNCSVGGSGPSAESPCLGILAPGSMLSISRPVN